MPASQDYRDGAAYGALELARRLTVVESFGFPLSPHNVQNAADEIRKMMGGHVGLPVDPVEVVGAPEPPQYEYNVSRNGEVDDEGASWFDGPNPAAPDFSPPLDPDEIVVRRVPAGDWMPVPQSGSSSTGDNDG